MRKYEVTFIFPTREDDFAKGREFAAEEFKRVGATVENQNDMGERDLAYPVKKATRGHYVCFTVQMEPDKVAELDKSFKLQSEILKYLFVNLEAK